MPTAAQSPQNIDSTSGGNKRQIFVAYSYRDYPKDDYRKVFNEISAEYQVDFIFADEKITNMHIMQKILSYIRAADFSLFDISGWNPNVTLELGLAVAEGTDWYIAFNPSLVDVSEVPSDLRGIDRIQYKTYTDFGAQLRILIDQRYPRRKQSIDDFIDELQDQTIKILGSQGGMTISDLANVTGSSVAVMQLAVRPMVTDGKLVTTGRRKAMKYYLPGTAPKNSTAGGKS